MARHLTPAVRALAAQLGVDVDLVSGTGAGGRVTPADVTAAATLPAAQVPTAPKARAELEGAMFEAMFPQRAVAAMSPGERLWAELFPPATVAAASAPTATDSTADLDAQWSRNPLATTTDPESQWLYDLASSVEPVPTLFPTGDLPPFTASGIDPQLLLKLPWMARHVAASVADREFVGRLFQECAPRTADSVAIASSHYWNQGVADYQQRINNWLSGNTPTQIAYREEANFNTNRPSST